RRSRIALRARVAGWHHHDHWLRALGGDQIVEDEAGASDGAPRVVAVTGAVQQVEDRVLLRAGLVARRRVDVHAPERFQRGRVVVHFGDAAVRHVSGVERVRAGDVYQAP